MGIRERQTVRLCGIDPSLHQTGYGIIRVGLDGRHATLIEAGVIRTESGRTLSERLTELGDAVDEILAEYHPDLVGLEQLYSHYKHPRTAILMGHARGVLMLAAARAGIRILSLSPTRVKRSLTGNGRAGKAQMQRAIMAALNLPSPPDPPDVADALAIALCAGTCYSALAPVKALGVPAAHQEVDRL